LKNAGEDAKKIGIMVASHNEDTVRFAIEKMKEIGISPEDKVICFGQLLGMCDYITFPLGNLNVYGEITNNFNGYFNCF
jgi:proline dehydrogenase